MAGQNGSILDGLSFHGFVFSSIFFLSFFPFNSSGHFLKLGVLVASFHPKAKAFVFRCTMVGFSQVDLLGAGFQYLCSITSKADYVHSNVTGFLQHAIKQS